MLRRTRISRKCLFSCGQETKCGYVKESKIFEFGTMGILFVVSFLVFIGAVFLLVKSDADYEIGNLVKPITVIQYGGFLSFAFLLNILKPVFLTIRRQTYEILMVLAFFCIMATLFEMLWSFGYWFSTYELRVMEGHPDTSQTLDSISYKTSPVLKNPFYEHINLNKSFKKNVLLFMMSVYLTYFLLQVGKTIGNKNIPNRG